MKIHNSTRYRTREIRKIITATHRHVAQAEGPLRTWRRLRVEVVYTRTAHTSGCAWLHGGLMRLRLRNPDSRAWPFSENGERPAPVTAGSLISLTWHELFHCYGYRHRQMARYFPPKQDVLAIAALAGMQPSDLLPLYGADAAPKTEPSAADQAAAELRAALQKRKEWTARAKRAKTALGKYREREMRARRKLAELGQDPDAIAASELGRYRPAMPGDIKIR